ncbi:MAG: response regulator [Anaerolineae bacterium]
MLLLEDNAQQVELVRAYLDEVRHTPFKFLTAPRLADAQTLLAQQDVDVVLLDLRLLDSQGFETFTQLYTTAGQIPIVVLTGIDEEKLALKAVQAGAQDYLVKDEVSSTLLSRAIRYAIERQRQQEALKQRNKEMAVLNAIIRGMSRSLELEEVLTEALNQILSLTIFNVTPQCGLIFLKNPHSGRLENAACVGLAEALPCVREPVDIEACLCGLAAKRGEVVISDDEVSP